jgi:phospholipid/cholesterol/gamma-HCH transport system permease protein
MVTGRSGSAFAAELGTMKVNEELNALVTMGLDPVRFLVVQRILAGMIVTPLLTVYAVVLGLGGGTIVMMSLGYPLQTVMVQLESSVKLGDLFLAISKGLVFGAIVATVGCLRGLQTARGPAAVGASTTRAVVAGILLVIIADAVFSIVLYSLK